MRIGKDVLQKILLALLMMVFIIYAFLSFMYQNNDRIITQNQGYISDAATQKAQRLEYIFREAQKNLDVLSYMYGDTNTEPVVDEEWLSTVANRAPFDYIEFADKSGMTTSLVGESTDVSNREYFIKGMQGESGIDVVLDSRLTQGKLLMFYTPLKMNNQIVGVFMGLYDEKQLEELLYSSYFGEQSRTFLCTRNGDTIAGSSKEGVPENVLNYFQESGSLPPEDLEKMRTAFAEESSYSIRYNSITGPGTAYITRIRNTDFMIFQSFPSKVTDTMMGRANSTGLFLAIKLIVGLALYIIFILVSDYRQRRHLIKENTEMSYVIDGTTKLFDRFILVDLENDTYRYLADTCSINRTIPDAGAYPVLVEYLTSLMVNPEDKESIGKTLEKENIRRELGEKVESLCFEYYVQRDEMNWERLNVISLERHNGVVSLALIARQDVTEYMTKELQKKMALQEAFRAVEAANQAKSDFLSRMSHDIRTPMNAIMGMTAIAAMNLDSSAKVKNCLDKITISSRHLLGLINEVLDMSKIESGKLVLSEEEFNLSETIENLKTIFYPQIEAKKQQFNISIVNIQHERLIGDDQRLQQVFVNIMGNAVKFTPEGGIISLKINEKSSNRTGTALYEFIFADNGIGMDSEFMKHMFEPFSRANDSRVGQSEGTGLGMSIAKSIVHMMGGNIQVKSVLGQGTEFTVTVHLQFCREESEKLDEFSGRRVLVLEHEQAECENICGLLKDIGMCPESAADEASALQRMTEAKNKDEEYDVLILGCETPDENTTKTVEDIREQFGQKLPIVISSAHDLSVMEQGEITSEVQGFISKPLFKSKLVRLMKDLLEEKHEVDNESVISDKNYNGKRVLLVEDNEMNSEIAAEILGMAGLTVDIARDGLEAVEKMKECQEDYYKIIFMDIQMPNMNGYEATTAIRNLDRNDVKTIPIIAMSANAFADDIRKGKQAGMDAHLAKPIDIPELMSVIDTWLK